jgi:CheY-like chemotaxis protein
MFLFVRANFFIMLRNVRILLADDDRDDHFVFSKVVLEHALASEVISVYDGEALMRYLVDNEQDLPDIVFLDLNMPLKKGEDCLLEIRANKYFSQLPIVMYSTSFNKEVVRFLQENGANFCLQKQSEGSDLAKYVSLLILDLRSENKDQMNELPFVLGKNRTIR